MQPVTHLLFDFFGTLVHYSDSWVEQGYQRSHRVLAEGGAECSYDEFLTTWSATFSRFEARALASLEEYSMTSVCEAFLAGVLHARPSSGLVELFRDTYLDEWNQGVRPIPGVSSLLDQLSRNYCLALVSNTHHADVVVKHLQSLKVHHHFSTIVTSVEHGRRKPSACIFHRALALTQGSAASALHIGDSYTADYVGATAAGLRCLLIDELEAHPIPGYARIGTILDLDDALRRPA